MAVSGRPKQCHCELLSATATFVVRGRAGRYEVIFGVCGARCSCKDNQFHWATTACKHQLFVLLRVIGVPADDISSLTVTDMQELLTSQGMILRFTD